jgi:hypothetical protein
MPSSEPEVSHFVVHFTRREVKAMKKFSVRKLETLRTTAALYGLGCTANK